IGVNIFPRNPSKGCRSLKLKEDTNVEDSTGAAVTDRTEMLPIDSLHPNSWNRKTFSPDGLTELTASIRANGILEALVVRPIPNTPDHFEICSGNRRWLAAGQAGLKEIPCRIQALSDIQ